MHQAQESFTLHDSLLQQLKVALNDEFVALKNRAIDDIEKNAQKKTQLLNQLSMLNQEIHTSVSAEEYDQLMQRSANDLKHCKQQNSVNGKLIEFNLIASRKLSAILARARDKDSVTYNGHGVTQPRASMPLGIKA